MRRVKPKSDYSLVRNYTELGAYLQEQRVRAGVTQRELSLELQYSSAQFISNFERGISSPPASKLKVIIKRLKLNREEVVKLYLAGDERELRSKLN